MTTSEAPLKILIAEDHAILRMGLRLLLEGKDRHVVGEAADGEAAVALTASLHPDIVLMDVSMPKMSGIEAAQLIRQTNSEVKIVMCTSMDNDEHIYASLGAGVNGYCLKEITAERLIAGINIVRDGDLWLDSNIAAKVLKNLAAYSQDQKSSTAKPAIAETSQISKEEMHVLRLIVEGLHVGEIAERIGQSEDDVRRLEESIMLKLPNARPAPFSSASGSTLSKEQQATTAEFDDLRIGTVFADKYQILDRLGRGGMSVVYKARHLFLKRTVALKVLNTQLIANVNNCRRFRQEAEAASAIRHPNVIDVFDFGLSPAGEPYLVMDYIEGRSLEDVLKIEKYIDRDRAIDIFTQVASGLSELHRHGIIHRDLKPSNIMLFDNNGKEQVCLIDFGIAKLLQSASDSRLTKAGEVLGSPCYVSPEQAQNLPLDERSDIYSLGCTMYEALTGELPFDGEYPWETMLKHVTEDAVPMRIKAPFLHIPESLELIVTKAMQKSTRDRFQSMEQLQHRLVFAKAALV